MFKTKTGIPILYILLLLLGFGCQHVDPRFTELLAIYPRDFTHLPGVITTVFLHKDLEHLSGNAMQLAICLFGIFHFYREIALKVTLNSHLLTGILIWIFARPSFHIGASGLVYALIFFILVSGLTRKNRQLLVFAFVVLVFQGGLIWGIFPQGNNISWESHLLGALSGAFFAILYSKEGPGPDQAKTWDDEDETVEDEYENL